MCPNLRDTVGIATLPFANSIGEGERENTLWGNDTTNYEEGVDLFTLFDAYTNGTIYTGKEGKNDLDGCGGSSDPCKTVDAAVCHFSGSLHVLKVKTAGSVVKPIDLSDIRVESNDEVMKGKIEFGIDMGGLGIAGGMNGGDLWFLRISFVFPVNLGDGVTCLLLSQGTSLSFTSSSFEIDNSPLYFSLVVVLSGSVLCDDVSVVPSQARTFSSPFTGFEMKTGGEVSVKESEFGNIVVLGNSLFSLSSSSSSLSFENCSVNDVRGSMSQSSVLNVLSSNGMMSVVVKNVSFVTCSALSCEKGGGICVGGSQGGSVSVENSSFSSCSCDLVEPGRGGGMYLRLGREDVRLSVKTLEFGSNEGWRGRNMFLECVDLR
jgi:hypothetical protein